MGIANVLILIIILEIFLARKAAFNERLAKFKIKDAYYDDDYRYDLTSAITDIMGQIISIQKKHDGRSDELKRQHEYLKKSVSDEEKILLGLKEHASSETFEQILKQNGLNFSQFNLEYLEVFTDCKKKLHSFKQSFTSRMDSIKKTKELEIDQLWKSHFDRLFGIYQQYDNSKKAEKICLDRLRKELGQLEEQRKAERRASSDMVFNLFLFILFVLVSWKFRCSS